jgi:hypothetical protein
LTAKIVVTVMTDQINPVMKNGTVDDSDENIALRQNMNNSMIKAY